MKRAAGRDARGMILINVLVIVMLATGVLAIMVAGGDSNIERSSRLRFAAQAMAIARGGELSAWAHARVVIGGTSQRLTSLLHRTTREGRPRVVAVRRWRGTPPLGAPLFP